MSEDSSKPKCFFGTATVGTKGQIVIPADAREAFGIAPGDKVVVIGVKERGMLGICPVENVESLLVDLTQKLADIRDMTNQEKEGK